MSDLQRIFDKLETQGEAIARIDVRTQTTENRVDSIDSKLDQIRTGEWDCPGKKEVLAEVRTHTHNDGNTVVKEEDLTLKSLKKKVMSGAIFVASVVVGLGIAGWILHAMFGG